MEHAAPTAPKFYFVSEIATAMRRSEASVRWLIHVGELESTKIAGRRVVTQQQLDAFFAKAGA